VVGQQGQADTSEADRKGLLEAVTNLVTYTTPLKAANSVPERTEAMLSQINDSFRRESLSHLPKSTKSATYFFLGELLPREMVSRLLGSIVLDVRHPLSMMPGDGSQTWRLDDDWTSVNVTENYSIAMESIMSTPMAARVDATVPVSGAPVAIETSTDGPYSSRHAFGPKVVTTHTLSPPASYVEWIVSEHLDRLGMSSWSRSCYLIVGIKTARVEKRTDISASARGTAESIFAVKYWKITYKQGWLSGSTKVKTKPYNKGAMFGEKF